MKRIIWSAIKIIRSLPQCSRSLDRHTVVEQACGIRRLVYWFLAGLFFILALIGVILPGIPTTPFLLLMCFFLLRVSPSLHAKAMAWPVFSAPLRDWEEHQAVRQSVKWIAGGMVVILVGSTLIWASLSFLYKTIVLLAATCGLIVIYYLPTVSIDR